MSADAEFPRFIEYTQPDGVQFETTAAMHFLDKLTAIDRQSASKSIRQFNHRYDSIDERKSLVVSIYETTFEDAEPNLEMDLSIQANAEIFRLGQVHTEQMWEAETAFRDVIADQPEETSSWLTLVRESMDAENTTKIISEALNNAPDALDLTEQFDLSARWPAKPFYRYARRELSTTFAGVSSNELDWILLNGIDQKDFEYSFRWDKTTSTMKMYIESPQEAYKRLTKKSPHPFNNPNLVPSHKRVAVTELKLLRFNRLLDEVYTH